jgi:hypothetical protein
MIQSGIDKSKFAVVINTETFAKTKWTKMELDHIRKNEIPWFQVMRGGTKHKCDEPAIFSRKAEDVVQEILFRRPDMSALT